MSAKKKNHGGGGQFVWEGGVRVRVVGASASEVGDNTADCDDDGRGRPTRVYTEEWVADAAAQGVVQPQ